MSQQQKRVKTIVVDHGKFFFQQVKLPVLHPNEALIRVTAISLDRKDVERALKSTGRRTLSDRDFAGFVERPAADGSGPGAGMRVAGLVRSGGWAELAIVPSGSFVEISETVTFAQAATLPISGLAAMRGLDRNGLLAAQRVLVARATGSVGLLAVQLAHASSADVTAIVRMPEHEALMEEYGADHVLIEEVAAVAKSAPFDYVLDLTGGLPAEAALRMLRQNGAYVFEKQASRPGSLGTCPAPLSRGKLGLSRGPVCRLPLAVGLHRVLSLARTRVIQPHVDIEDSWTEITAVARAVEGEDHVGKAVLHVG